MTRRFLARTTFGALALGLICVGLSVATAAVAGDPAPEVPATEPASASLSAPSTPDAQASGAAAACKQWEVRSAGKLSRDGTMEIPEGWEPFAVAGDYVYIIIRRCIAR